MEVRPCQPGDYPAIRNIHNFYIEHTVINFEVFLGCFLVGSSRVDLQACKLEYSIRLT